MSGWVSIASFTSVEVCYLACLDFEKMSGRKLLRSAVIAQHGFKAVQTVSNAELDDSDFGFGGDKRIGIVGCTRRYMLEEFLGWN